MAKKRSNRIGHGYGVKKPRPECFFIFFCNSLLRNINNVKVEFCWWHSCPKKIICLKNEQFPNSVRLELTKYSICKNSTQNCSTELRTNRKKGMFLSCNEWWLYVEESSYCLNNTSSFCEAYLEWFLCKIVLSLRVQKSGACHLQIIANSEPSSGLCHPSRLQFAGGLGFLQEDCSANWSVLQRAYKIRYEEIL